MSAKLRNTLMTEMLRTLRGAVKAREDGMPTLARVEFEYAKEIARFL